MIPFSFSHLSTQPALQCRWTVCQFLARSPLWSGERPPRQEFTTLLPNIENNPSSLFHLFAKLFCNPSSPPQSSIRAAFRQVSKHHQQLLSKVRSRNMVPQTFCLSLTSKHGILHLPCCCCFEGISPNSKSLAKVPK